MTAVKSDQVRRDIFAVKVFGDDGKNGDWCYVKMFRSFQSAKNFRHELFMDHRRPFPLVEIKIVHPQQWVVDYFVACGNRVEE